MKHTHASCLAAILLSACASIPRPTITEPQGAQLQPAAVRPRLDSSITDPAAQRDTLSLIDATYTVIQSNEFRQNFEKLDEDLGELWLSPHGETLPVNQVLLVYLGADKNHMPVRSTLKWGRKELTGPAEDNPAEALIELGPSKLAQWRSNSLIHKSCAINTLAHELTHTIPRDTQQYIYLFTDRRRPWATFLGRPLVSYTVGAVAQCTYLQIQGDELGKDLRACIERWGTNQFYSSGCATKPG